jgi:ribonuclease P protein component
MGLCTFGKEERVVRRKDFIDLNLRGKRYLTKHFVVVLRKNGRHITRLGINVGKRVGGSVERNRIKRMVREFFRLNKQGIPKGYDIMIVALEQGDAVSFSRVNKELGDLLLKDADLFS